MPTEFTAPADDVAIPSDTAGSSFSLIECLRYTPNLGLRHFDLHLDRLAGAARYFEFEFDLAELRRRLARIEADDPMKVRTALSRAGDVHIDISPIPTPTREPVRVAMDTCTVRSDDDFMQYKTSNRDVYRRARGRFPDVDDVILVNQRGEITESTIANVAVSIDGTWWTPPLESGCLPGIERGVAIAQTRLRERVMGVSDLLACDGLMLLSSVRGWRSAEIEERRSNDGVTPRRGSCA